MTNPVLKPLRGGITWLLAAAALVLFLGTATAQNAPYDEAKLDAFVEAAVKVTQIRQQWVPKIQSAESKEAAQKMSTQAIAAMREAVNGVDNIDAKQYDEIAAAVKEDDNLRARVDEKFKQKTGQ